MSEEMSGAPSNDLPLRQLNKKGNQSNGYPFFINFHRGKSSIPTLGGLITSVLSPPFLRIYQIMLLVLSKKKKALLQKSFHYTFLGYSGFCWGQIVRLFPSILVKSGGPSLATANAYNTSLNMCSLWRR